MSLVLILYVFSSTSLSLSLSCVFVQKEYMFDSCFNNKRKDFKSLETGSWSLNDRLELSAVVKMKCKKKNLYI